VKLYLSFFKRNREITSFGWDETGVFTEGRSLRTVYFRPH
jgi:hypothetical protein